MNYSDIRFEKEVAKNLFSFLPFLSSNCDKHIAVYACNQRRIEFFPEAGMHTFLTHNQPSLGGGVCRCESLINIIFITILVEDSGYYVIFAPFSWEL